MIQLIATLFTFLLLTSALQAQVDSSRWIGEWVNVDANTSGTTRLVIAQEGDHWTIQGFGKCSPQDCDWGAVPLEVCTVDKNPQNLIGLASWTPTFKKQVMILKFKSRGLVADSLHIYTDNSGRSNHAKSEAFRKKK